jgi:prepilin-type N-terminal cleavage/methylation domain-containing protein
VPDQKSKHGFTLVETLLAIAILGIIASAVLAMTSGVLRFSRGVNVTNEQLADLNDAAGYLALNGRRAMRVIGGSDDIIIRYAGDTFTCSTVSADGPCVALLVPVVNRNSGASDIVSYELLAYRVMPISAWTDNPGFPEGWDGPDTPVMVEYRIPLACSSACNALPALPALANAGQASLVLPDLFMMDNSGNAVEPFILSSSVVLEITFNLRTRGSGQEAERRIPADGPVAVSVTRRP